MIVAALDALSDNNSDGVLSCRDEPGHDILDACLDAIADDDGPSDAEPVIAVSVDELANVALDGLSDTVSEVGSENRCGNHIVEIGESVDVLAAHGLADLDSFLVTLEHGETQVFVPPALASRTAIDKLIWLSGCLPDSEAPQDELNLAKYFINGEHTVGQNLSSRETVGSELSRRCKFAEARQLAMALAMVVEKAMWRRVVGASIYAKFLYDQMATAGAENCYKLALHLVAGSYDGVDLKLRTDGMCQVPANIVRAEMDRVPDAADDAQKAAALYPHYGLALEKQVHEDAGPTKVLQSEYHNVVVVGLPNGTVSVTIGNQLDMLQTSDHTTGDVMAALVSRHNLATVTDASKFDRYVRSVCTDRYYPNKTGEAEVAHRFLNALLHLFCHCHVLACKLKFTKVLWKSAANGARAYLRSLRAPGQMRYFRAAARVVLWRKLQVERGPSHLQDGAAEYKVFILDILASRDEG